jgi:nucleolar protein 56
LSEKVDIEPSIYVIETLIGIFGLTKEGVIVEKVLFPPDSKQIATAIDRLRRGEVIKEIAELAEKMKQRGYRKFVFSSKTLAESIGESYNVETILWDRLEPTRKLRENLEELAIEYGLMNDVNEFNSVSHEVSLLMARKAIQRAQSDRGAAVNQSVQLLNEIDRTLNVLSNKLREWYGLHFPELDRQVDHHKTYANIVEKFGDRSNINIEGLVELGFRSSKSSNLIKMAEKSMGAPMIPEDNEQLKGLALNILGLYEYRQKLELYISSLAVEVAPNLSEVAGTILAAKLMEKAGGIKNLAMKPSSTIQVLGAEKALYRSKKSGSRPPKHGLIFQHPYIHSKPKKARGHLARVLAGKLAIAARADAFSGSSIGVQLRKELDEK